MASDKLIQLMELTELNQTLFNILAESQSCEILSRKQDLPYVFDLFHDIKEWYEVDDILSGRPHASRLTAAQLRAFALENGFIFDHEAVYDYMQWTNAGSLLDDLYANHQLAITAVDSGVQASAIDVLGYYHVFHDSKPLAAAMRCALAIYQRKVSI